MGSRRQRVTRPNDRARDLSEYQAFILRARPRSGGERSTKRTFIRVEHVNDRSVRHFNELSAAFRHIEKTLAECFQDAVTD
jgi:hypothetical protein